MKMLFLSFAQAHELANFAWNADFQAKSELIRNLITGENDYTSVLLRNLRQQINCYSRTGLHATAFKLNQSGERKTGSDAAIIIESNGEYKVALFEAKWPRFTAKVDDWDSVPIGGISHFTSQLQRQSTISPHYAVFEMFYSECPNGRSPGKLIQFGSTCVWHRDINAVLPSRSVTQPWKKPDVLALAPMLSIFVVIFEVAICSEGNPVKTDLKSLASDLRVSSITLVSTSQETVDELTRLQNE